MKKVIVIMWITCLVLASNLVQAEEREIKTVEGSEISTLVIVRDDWYSGAPHSQEGIFYWYGENFGAGVNVCTTPETDYFGVKPYLTWRINKSPFVLIGGFSTNSFGVDYAHGGVWFFPKFGEWKTYIDVRQYQAISSNATSDYFDSFIEAVYPVTKKLDVGPVVIYDYWWQDDRHDFLLVGPVAYYHFNEQLALFVRPSLEWNRNDGKSDRAEKVRLGFKVTF